MSFSFEARTLLELGKELISTDEVALFELIKNAVDAHSPTVEILVKCSLTHSNYQKALRLVQSSNSSLSKVTAFLQSKLVDPEIPECKSLLRNLKRSKDREEYVETLDEHYSKINSITVLDSGEGMSFQDLKNVYLRIGTRYRRRQNEDGARNLGDKGIGRISAMRLGELLTVKTTKSGEAYWNLLEVDWGRFSHEEEMLVNEVKVVPRRGRQKKRKDESGTEIRIEKLNADWDWTRFNELLDGKVARFIDPFERGLANKLLIAKHNGQRALVPSVPKPLMDHAHAACHATFGFDAGEPFITGKVDYREKKRATAIEVRGSEVLTQIRMVRKRRAKRGHAAFAESPVSIEALEKLGRFELEVYWYNRGIVKVIENLTDSPTTSRAEIARWSGGPMLYRHGFRVLPFGEPDDDWISLDERAFGAAGFKLNRQQVFGRVRINTPHNHLSEQTNREGLVQSDVSDALKKLVAWVLHNEFRNFINEVDEHEKLLFRKEELQNNQILKAEESLKTAVASLRKQLRGDHKAELKRILTTATRLRKEALSVMKQLDKVEEQSIEDREKFVYLAGVGLMTEFVFHELGRAVAHTMGVISDADVTPKTISALEDQLQTLYKRVAAFDELTGEKRQTKSRFDLCELVRDVLANHEREFNRHSIELDLRLPDGECEIRAVRGMVIQILENLIVNAAYWLKRQAEYEQGFSPELTVILDWDKRRLVVEDNGPGVAESRKERIFQPFVTSKPSGMGKGLGLFIARDMAEYHHWTLQTEAKKGRVHPQKLNGFVLQLS